MGRNDSPHSSPAKNHTLDNTPEYLYTCSVRTSKARQRERSVFGLQFGSYPHSSKMPRSSKMPLTLTAFIKKDQIK